MEDINKVYVATWTSEYGDDRKAFAKKEDAQRQLRKWLGEYIFDIFEDDGIDEVKEYLDNLYHPDGYNVGFNVEGAGGQSVWHAHMHVLPRYNGDTLHPRGGIRKLTKI